MFSPLGFVAVTPAPTKSNETASVERDEPSSLTVIADPPPEPIEDDRTVNFSSRYFPTYKYADAVTGSADALSCIKTIPE